MNRLIFIIFMVVSLCSVSIAGADDNSYLISRMWKRQERGIQGVLRCFKDNCPPSAYREHLLQIVSAELNLQVYGVSPKDSRLVSHLASKVKSIADFPIFAYKLFKKRLNDVTGFSPEPKGSFEGETFRIIPKNNSSQAFTVRF